MKKNLLPTLLALFTAAPLFGQDLIVTRDNEKIEARTVAITDSVVTYRLFSDAASDDTIHKIDKSAVRMILWENGDQDDFGETKIKPNAATDVLIPDKVLKKTGFQRFRIGDQKFSIREANSYIVDPNVVKKLKRGITLEKTAIILGVSGAAVFAGGLSIINYGFRGDEGSMLFGMLIGGPIMGCGILMGVASIITGTIGAVLIKKNIRRYNNEHAWQFGFAPTPGGLGLQLNF